MFWCVVLGAIITVNAATLLITNSIHDYSWNSFTNQCQIGDTVQFNWTGFHNVEQILNVSDMSWHNWPNALISGPRTNGGSFTWQVTTNFRPGNYYFNSDTENMGVNVAVTAPGDKQHGTVAPFPCTQLDSKYNINCTVYEINNFQTLYDWIPYSWTVNQGDLVRWRWSNYRNIVQINDVPALYQVAQWNGGITSGTKDYCVPGADFECINNPRSQGFYIWDTSNYRPGIYHFSDDRAPLDGGGNGMPCLIDLRWAPVNQTLTSSCCSIDSTAGTQCAVHEITNFGHSGSCGPYCWYPYIAIVKQWDIVRWQWTGNHSVYQVNVTAGNVPGTIYNGGLQSGPAVNCIPGPNMGCINVDPESASFVWQVKGQAPGNYYFSDAGSQMGCIVVVIPNSKPNVTANPCPVPISASNINSSTYFVITCILILLFITQL